MCAIFDGLKIFSSILMIHGNNTLKRSTMQWLANVVGLPTGITSAGNTNGYKAVANWGTHPSMAFVQYR